jgi:hypothetical protein
MAPASPAPGKNVREISHTVWRHHLIARNASTSSALGGSSDPLRRDCVTSFVRSLITPALGLPA